MKRYLILGLLVLNTLYGSAQNPKTKADSLKTETNRLTHDDAFPPGGRLPEGTVLSFEGRNYREYDGFLLDLDAMMQPHATQPMGLVPPSLLYNPFANYRTPVTDYVFRFRPSNGVTYGSTTYPGGFNPNAPTLRSATFRLNNSWRLTTYGEYDADGYKVRKPHVLPGQRNTFNGAFEMKSENGNFGIRIGVQRY